MLQVAVRVLSIDEDRNVFPMPFRILEDDPEALHL